MRASSPVSWRVIKDSSNRIGTCILPLQVIKYCARFKTTPIFRILSKERGAIRRAFRIRRADLLLTPDRPNFNLALDPKCDWALRHLEQFPIEVTTADYATLMRVPGIGSKSALRILKARRMAGRVESSFRGM